MITSGDYAPRCRNIGIECWDGKDFSKNERKWIWIRRTRVTLVRSVILAGIGVFAYSVWDKSYDTHDQAAAVRKEATKIGKEAYATAKSSYDAVVGWINEIGKKIGS